MRSTEPGDGGVLPARAAPEKTTGDNDRPFRIRMDLKRHIREVPDFPKPGILFYDINTLLGHAEALSLIHISGPTRPY